MYEQIGIPKDCGRRTGKIIRKGYNSLPVRWLFNRKFVISKIEFSVNLAAKGAKMNLKRIAAFFIDFFISALINNVLFLFFIIIPLMRQNPPDNIILRAIFSTSFAYLYLILRDLPKSGSIGKMVMKLKIIDAETKEPASIGKRFLRNVPIIFTWVEIIIFLFAKSRLGDMIAKTDVVQK